MSQLTVNQALTEEVAHVTSQVQQIHSLNSSLKQEIAGMKQQLQEVSSIQQQHKAMKQEHQTMQKTVQSVKQETDNALRELAPLQHGNQVAKAVQKEVGKLNAELGTMKSGDIGSMKMVVASTKKDLQDLRKTIYDSGVLVKKVDLEDHHEDHPPVGCIELGEDIFSARLLVRLGFEKAKQDAAGGLSMAKLAASDSEGDERSLVLSEDSQMAHFDDLVSGIQVPEVVQYGQGYFKVSYGWLAVCLATMFTQMLAVFVLLRHSFGQADICRLEPWDAPKKLTLHLAKGCAVFVAGTIMGKELMDTVNFFMVSELLLGHSTETILSALTRLLTILMIACANVMSFTCSDDATEVFMSMTALSFLGDLGTFGLDVAKRGVLGHHVSKTMTELNFSISLLSIYPDWFATIRTVAVFFQFGFSAFFITLLVFVLEIPECNPDGSSPGNVFDVLLPWKW